MGDWVQLGEDIDGEGDCDQSGRSVSLSNDGKIVAIGAPTYYGPGHVRVFEYSDVTSNWVQLGEDIDGEAGGDYSGGSVSLSANCLVVAIGAEGNGGGYYTAPGHVRVYAYTEEL